MNLLGISVVILCWVRLSFPEHIDVCYYNKGTCKYNFKTEANKQPQCTYKKQYANDTTGCPKFGETGQDVTEKFDAIQYVTERCDIIAKCLFLPGDEGETCAISGHLHGYTYSVRDCPGIISIEPLMSIKDGPNEKIVPYVRFRLIGPKSKFANYIAVGLRTAEVAPTLMDDALVMACTRGRKNGMDVLGFARRYTRGLGLAQLPNQAEALENGDIKGLSIKIVDDRIRCEFYMKHVSTVSRPEPYNDKKLYNLSRDSYYIFGAYGKYQLDELDKESILFHGPHSRKSERSHFRFSTCGRDQLRRPSMCLGLGGDGCGNVWFNCSLYVQIIPDGRPTDEEIAEGKPDIPNATDIHLQSQFGNSIMLGFGVPEFRKSKDPFDVASIGLLICCERENKDADPELVYRYNTCFQNFTGDVNECEAILLGRRDVFISPKPQGIIDLVDYTPGDQIKQEGWFYCSFRLNSIKNPIYLLYPETQKYNAYDLLNDVFYTSIASAEVGGASVKSIPFNPTGLLMNVSARVAVPIYDWNYIRSDFQIFEQKKVKDTRPMWTFNPKRKSTAAVLSYNLDGYFGVILILAASFTLF